MGRTKLFFRRYWKYIVILVTPLVLLALLRLPEETIPQKAGQCLYLLVLMAVYWCTEAIPIPMTGLLPIILMPTMGLIKAKDVCVLYFTDSIGMIFGGIMVALAVEKCDLHRRIAITTLYNVGTKPLWLMLGFILPTWFLSMWISNTATTSMMLPIVESVIDSLDKGYKSIATDDTPTTTKTPAETRLRMFGKSLTLAIAYSANIGGTASLVGTLPNVLVKGQSDIIWNLHGYSESPLNFASWFLLGLPVSVVCVILLWLWLSLFFNGFGSLCVCTSSGQEADEVAVRDVISREYKGLGRLRFAEVMVALMFLLLVCLWFFQSPGFMPGWASLSCFQPGYMHSITVSLLVPVLLSMIPDRFPRSMADLESMPTSRLLDWHTVQKRMPFGTFYLIGGGLALAKASDESGLSAWTGNHLSALQALPGGVVLLIVCLLVAFMTDITSNTAMCAMLLPIAASLSETRGKNPLYLMLPAAISASFAFMLPVATPPNALAYAYGRIRILDMIKTGCVLNIVCALVVAFLTHTLGDAYYDFSVIPWNSTGQLV